MRREYFGTDGIRGRVNEFPMTAENALKFTKIEERSHVLEYVIALPLLSARGLLVIDSPRLAPSEGPLGAFVKDDVHPCQPVAGHWAPPFHADLQPGREGRPRGAEGAPVGLDTTWGWVG